MLLLIHYDIDSKNAMPHARRKSIKSPIVFIRKKDQLVSYIKGSYPGSTVFLVRV